MGGTLSDLLDAAIAAPNPTPMFAVGQTVRVLKSLECNVHAVREFLGAKGTVERVGFSMFSKRVWYDIKVGDRVEPFEQDELDWRFAKLGRTGAAA